MMRSNPNFVGVVRTRGIHDKKYSLQWKPLLIIAGSGGGQSTHTQRIIGSGGMYCYIFSRKICTGSHTRTRTCTL